MQWMKLPISILISAMAFLSFLLLTVFRFSLFLRNEIIKCFLSFLSLAVLGQTDTSDFKYQTDTIQSEHTIHLLRNALETCRSENIRLMQYVPDSVRYPRSIGKKPLAFRVNNITWRENRKQISMYQVLTEMEKEVMYKRIVTFLYQQNLNPVLDDTIQVDQFILPELYPAKMKATWVIEPFSDDLNVLKVWFRLPDGAYLNPENYPGYHEKISAILKYLFYEKP